MIKIIRAIIFFGLFPGCCYAASASWVFNEANANVAASFSITGGGSISSPVTWIFYYRGPSDEPNVNCAGGELNASFTSAHTGSYNFISGHIANASAASIYAMINAVDPPASTVHSINVVPTSDSLNPVRSGGTRVFLGSDPCFTVDCSSVPNECVYSGSSVSVVLNQAINIKS